MSILSKRMMQEVAREYRRAHGVRARFIDLQGRVAEGADPLQALSNTRRRRSYALQQSVDRGEPYLYRACPGVAAWVAGLEDRRRVHAGLLGGEVRVREETEAVRRQAVAYLVEGGMAGPAAGAFLKRLPVWPEARLKEAAGALQRLFYDMSGWRPVLMEENRLKVLRQEQFNQALEDQRSRGNRELYAFEKERMLLANIRAGDRAGATRILNEMLAAIFLSSGALPVLRARTIELLSCLVRAAIEDNPLLEPLIDRNHAWTERLVRAHSFEALSQVLMSALDDFIDGIYLHGVNRSNAKVSKALDYIGAHFNRPLTLAEVAAAAGLSPSRLCHVVRECTGRTVLQIVQEMRVRRAQHLLERTTRSCAEIAYEVGFSDQSYFTRHFRRLTGTTPARYRRARPA